MSDRNRFFNSSNPFMNEERYAQSAQEAYQDPEVAELVRTEGVMTVQGAVNKTLILTAIMFVSAIVGWQIPYMLGAAVFPVVLIGAIAAAIVSYFVYSRPQSAGTLAPVYAVLEGLVLGIISMAYANKFGGGIVFNALTLTGLCLAVMLAAYKLKIIQPTERFKSILVTATMSIMALYLVSFVIGMFGVSMPYLHSGGPIGILVSLVIVVVAALNLIIDFESFEKGEEYQAPKYMEWVSAVGLLVTLAWLYVELLRLLSKFRD